MTTDDDARKPAPIKRDLILEKARVELTDAEASCTLMAKAKTFGEVEAAWMAFLGSIERVWSKTLSRMKPYPRFIGWKGKYEKMRKEDDLLSYVIQARGCHEHTVCEIVGMPFRESCSGLNLPA